MIKAIVLPMMQLFLLAGCAERTLSLEDWRNYLNDPENGLRVQKQWNGIDLSITYKPTDALVWQDLGYPQEPVGQEVWDSVYQKYKDYAYFDLSLSHQDQALIAAMGPNDPRYFDVIQHLSFRMKQHTRLISDRQDTVSVFHSQYFRDYGYGASTNVLLVFENEKILASDHLELCISDMGLNMPTKRFQFEASDLKNIPSLNIELIN